MPISDTPLTNKQHAVPQNIMDVEFKLIGDLTLRQFAYLLVFGATAYFSFIGIVGLFKWPIVIISVMLGLGLAFVPIQDRGLDEWIVNFIRAVYSPTLRIWRKEPIIPSAFLYENINVVKQELITLAPTTSRRKLEEYLEYKTEDKKPDPLDIPETEYIMKVRKKFAGVTDGDTAVADTKQTGVGVSLEEPEIEVIPEEPVKPKDQTEKRPEEKDEKKEQATVQEFQPVKKEESKEEPKKEEKPPVSEKKDQKQKEQKPEEKKTYPQETKELKPEKTQQKTEMKTEIKKDQKPLPEKSKIEQPGKEKEKEKQVQEKTQAALPTPKPEPKMIDETKKFKLFGSKKQTARDSSVNRVPMTPDMHSGRRFTNLLPYGGELVLPIRGEKVIDTIERQKVQDDLNEKAEKLQSLLSQIKKSVDFGHKLFEKSEGSSISVSPKTPVARWDGGARILEDNQAEIDLKEQKEKEKSKIKWPEPPPRPGQPSIPEGREKEKGEPEKQEEPQTKEEKVKKEAENIVEKLKKENERLSQKIEEKKMEAELSKSPDETNKKTEELKKLEVQKERTQSDYARLKQQILELQNRLKEKEQQEMTGMQQKSADRPSYAKIPPLTNQPNVVSGIVKGPDGSVIEGLLLIIKDDRGEAVRAFKTNSIGQFILTTPLSNGIYTIEVSPSSSVEHAFDIISVEVKGEVIPPIEIIGKPK